MARARQSRCGIVFALVFTLGCGGSDGKGTGPSVDQVYPTTLDQTFVVVPEPQSRSYTLAVGPGEPHLIRNDLSVQPTKIATESPISVGTFFVVTDTHMTDEESPTRLELFDSSLILDGMFESAWRANEDLAPHQLAALVDAANAIMLQTGRAFDAALVLGDVTDNAQQNELEWGLDALDGAGRSSGLAGTLRPDSGLKDIDPATGQNRGERSLGFQGIDDQGNSIDPFLRPGRPNSNADFPVAGLHGPDGSPVPILMVVGNHDVLNCGTFDPASRLTFFSPDDYVGGLSKFGFQPGLANIVQWVRDHPGQPLHIADGLFGVDVGYDFLVHALESAGMVPEDLSPEMNPHFDLEKLVHETPADGSDDGVPIPADPARAYLGRGGYIERAHGAGYGFADTNGDGVVDGADGGWYAVDLIDLRPDRPLPLRLLGLNSTDAGKIDGGGYSPRQLAWLQAELDRAVRDEVLVVVLSHHPLASTGEGADELKGILLACPNVVLHLAGHTHDNRITPILAGQDSGRGYWQVETTSALVFPGQARIVEIVDNRDGTGSIFLTLLDHSALDWKNLDNLGALGRWAGFEDELKKGYDGTSSLGGLGDRSDRNCELIFAMPPGVEARLCGFSFAEPATSRAGFRAREELQER